MEEKKYKILGGKAYGSIPHLSGSRLGTADKKVNPGQEKIATVKTRDKKDVVIVQEKLDGCCCAVVKHQGELWALTRSGYNCIDSLYPQHQWFVSFFLMNKHRFDSLLQEGERAVGENLSVAHGTRYALHHEPFVLFDIVKGVGKASRRMPLHYLIRRNNATAGFILPKILHYARSAVDVETIKNIIDKEGSGHGAIDPVEGAVWRVERERQVDFLCKYVRYEKIDGFYLPQKTGDLPVWNNMKR
jgi:ATP-dependent RNA circularization protein (DNA/RNA ligase family)